jgi:bacterioferritin-associated ferredoxin
MIVCVCKAVSDRQIRSAVVNGSACCMRDIARDLGVGTCCGKCVPEAKAAIAASLPHRKEVATEPCFGGAAPEFA